jgi:hypothetical protein
MTLVTLYPLGVAACYNRVRAWLLLVPIMLLLLLLDAHQK